MKIICVGRNYAAHAEELGNKIPDSPIIFFKPDTALLRNNNTFFYPEYSKNIHYECELIYRVSREGKYIQRQFVESYIDGVGLGIDFTARDLQTKAKEKGHPWALAKGFNSSAPISAFKPLDAFEDINKLRFELKLNGESRQKGDASHMIWPLGPLVEYISQFFTLKRGDIIFTGTPKGVGPIQVGDRLQAWLEGDEMLNFIIR